MPRPSSIDLRPMNAEKSCRESADGARCSSFKYPGSSTSGLAVLCRCKKSNERRLLVVLGMFRESSSVSCVHRVRRFEGIEGWGVADSARVTVFVDARGDIRRLCVDDVSVYV